MNTPRSPDVQDAADLLRRLVACPSVNPKGRVPSGPHEGEARLVELLSALLSDWGAEISVREAAPGRPNLVARFEGASPDRSLMLEAHGDTVQAEDMTVPPFEPTVRDGKLFGRGACDAKGAMAAMLLGIRTVLDEDGRPPAELHFVSTCDEELGAGGARRLMEDGFRADAAVVGEPTALAIVHAHKGAVRWKITTRGVAAHTAEPSAGVNAISEMRKVLELIEGPVARALSRGRHPLLGEPTITVGTIRGGSQVNVVPSRCEIEVDRRIVPGETREEAAEEIVRGLESLRGTSGDFDCSWQETQWYPPLEEDPGGPLVRLIAGACRKVLGGATLAGAAWASNAGVFKAAGIPCVVFGPGSARQAHAPGECVELEQVAKAARVYAEIIRAFGSW